MILGGISTITTLTNSLGLGSVDPQKEAERIATIDTLKRDAIQAGTKDSRPYIRLACWAGASPTSREYALAVQYGMVQPGEACRVGSDSALAYAKLAKASVDAALAVGGVVNPIINDVVVEHYAQQARSALPWILIALGVVAVVWYTQKGR